MQIAKNTVVSLKYQLFGGDGEMIEETQEAVEYLHGGYGNMFPAVEKELEGRNAGETCRVRLVPDDGFGDYDADLVHVEPRDKFPDNVQIGMQFEGEVCQRYGVLQEKEMEGRKKTGIVRSTFVIDRKGLLKHALYGVSARGHAAEVLNLVKDIAKCK